MPKFVVYEIWTRSQVVEAETPRDAYDIVDPQVNAGYPEIDGVTPLFLSNWHAVEVPNE